MTHQEGCPECGSEDLSLVNIGDVSLGKVTLLIECPDGHTYKRHYEAIETESIEDK